MTDQGSLKPISVSLQGHNSRMDMSRPKSDGLIKAIMTCWTHREVFGLTNIQR